MRLKLFIVYAAILFTCKTVLAQNGQYQFSSLNINNGLSHNQVNSIYKDKRGFMWFGTMSGLNKYDGYTFKIYKHDPHNPNSLNDDCVVSICEGPGGKLWLETRNGHVIFDPVTEQFERNIKPAQLALNLPTTGSVRTIKKDSRGNFWFLFAYNGVYKYDPVKKKTQHFTENVIGRLYSKNLTSIEEDRNGNFWFVYQDGVLEKFDPRAGKVILRSDVVNKTTGGGIYSYLLKIDNDNDLWLYAKNSDLGVYYFNPRKNILKHLNKAGARGRLNVNVINNITQDENGIVWIATDHGGINLVDKKDFSIKYLLNREDDSKSIAQNTGFLYKDDMGIMWYGTYKRGISYYHKNIIKFPVYRHFGSDSNSMPFDDVNTFAEADAGNLWMGTNGGGLIYFNRKTGKYTQYKHNSNNTNSLTNDVIISLCVDHENKLWIGTYFGGLDCFDGKNFIHYKHDDKDEGSMSDNRVWKILEDSSNRLWVGTFSGGVNLFDREKKRFTHYKPNQPNSVHAGYISTIFEDRDNNIWFGSYNGVDVLQKKTGRFIRYIHDEKTSNSLIMNNVVSINQDSRGLMWISTMEGLNIFNPKNNKFSVLSRENGLPDNQVLNILEDNNQSMWLSTSKGICNVTLKPLKNGGYAYQFKNFDENDGLQGREFNLNASIKTSKGELVFGGGKGVNIFLPEHISHKKSEPILVLTDLQMFNKSINPGDTVEGHVILSKSISETDALKFHHNENAFSLSFADLNFFNPGKLQFEYKLENFDDNWIKSDNVTRKATYTNLDPGKYIFKVRAINDDGTVKENPLTLSIQITPPFWKTVWAYFLYAFCFVGILFYIRRRGIKKIESKFELELERQEAQRKRELDSMKIDFFTNISHELRTPISLILAPVEHMMKEQENNGNQNKLQLIYQNSKRLLNMTNQLLDFSKMTVQKLQLDLKEGDIIKLMKESSSLFVSLAEKKQINFSFKSDSASCYALFDHDKLERILFNLVSNALKFTPKNGLVNIDVNLLASNHSGLVLFELRVTDSGIGIPLDKHNKIFERFYQNDIPTPLNNQGSGIGLSIVKEFVSLMGGVVSVESKEGCGSSFIIRLPLQRVVKQEDKINVDTDILDTDKLVLPQLKSKDKKSTVLIVEDNKDFRAYLKRDLSEHYRVIEASNGRDGWQKALGLHPNLILSDINMPEIGGIDFCKKIRADKRTEHIPFILITGQTAEEQELVSLETGANDFITKPLNFEVLHFKIKNLLKHQRSVKETYQKQIEVKTSDLDIEGPDVKFTKKVAAIIEHNISNAGFSVEMLSDAVNMSRVALYKKMFQLLGKTPIEFIKTVRMKRAAQLLEMNQFTIAEISYQVGYNDPKYFTKAFKSEFSVLPSQYLSSHSKA